MRDRVTTISAVSLGVVIATLAWAAVAERTEPWRDYQQQYRDLVQREGDEVAKAAILAETIRPHEVSLARFGAVDRCTTCHMGMEPGAKAFEDRPPFQPHPGTWLESHPVGTFGCTSCHGGQGRALDPAVAHNRRHGGGPNAFTPASVRCSRCHPAAGLEGTRWVGRGVDLYFEHGCSGCHQPGRPGPGIGPDLSTIGLRGGAYLREVVLYPEKVYPLTIMPPMRYKIAEKGPDIDSLVTYLRTLEPWPRAENRGERRFDSRLCAGCHRVNDREMTPIGPGHKCTYLHDESDWLACGNCHGEREEPGRLPSEVPTIQSSDDQPAPEGGEIGGGSSLAEGFRDELRNAAQPVEARDPAGRCPHIEEAMSACGVCHREGER